MGERSDKVVIAELDDIIFSGLSKEQIHLLEGPTGGPQPLMGGTVV